MKVAESEHSAQSQVPGEVGRNLLDLEPLRSLGSDALDTTGFPAIIKIILREIEITWDNAFHEVTVRRADDLFDSASVKGPAADPIPPTGRITRAVFIVYFADSPYPVTVQISTPDRVTLNPGHDTEILERWLCQCHFRKP